MPVSQGASLDDIRAELRTTNRLLAGIAAKGLEQKEAIALLAGLGLQPKAIAEALGVRPNLVSVALHRLRRSNDPTQRAGGPNGPADDDAEAQ